MGLRDGQGPSAAEKAELVGEYLQVRPGEKRAWLVGRRIDPKRMSKWRRMYLFGDLELGLDPRDTDGMVEEDGARIRQLEKQLQLERAVRADELRAHREEIEWLEKANDALGRAIGLLHDRNAEREPTDES